MQAYAQFILLSFFFLVSTTACNDSDTEETSNAQEFYENKSTYYGKTSPEAIVNVSEIDAFTGDKMELEADENGDFSGDFSKSKR